MQACMCINMQVRGWFTQTVECKVGLIGAENGFIETASIYEVTGNALALKHSI